MNEQKTLASSNRSTDFDEKVIQISRVSKKTKGGNKMGFSILMVVGDRKGRVGVGLGKAGDVQAAMRKGAKKAKKKLITVPLDGTTIPFSVKVKKGAAGIMLKPAPKGSGVIAGGPVRAVVEAAGIRDISSKILGTNNQASNVYATFEALKQIEAIVKLKNIRLKSIAEIEAEEAKKLEELQKQAKKTADSAKQNEDSKKEAAKQAEKKAVAPKAAKPKTAKPVAKKAEAKTESTGKSEKAK
jgi:small subunit ribosomal protein S5